MLTTLYIETNSQQRTTRRRRKKLFTFPSFFLFWELAGILIHSLYIFIFAERKDDNEILFTLISVLAFIKGRNTLNYATIFSCSSTLSLKPTHTSHLLCVDVVENLSISLICFHYANGMLKAYSNLLLHSLSHSEMGALGEYLSTFLDFDDVNFAELLNS